MLRTTIALSLLILFTSCGVFRSADTVQETVQIAAEDPEERDFVSDVLSDLQQAKVDLLKERYPTLFVARALLGPKGATYSDEQIQNEVLNDLKIRFEEGFHILQESMREQGIRPKDLTYVSHSINEPLPNTMIRTMTVVLSSDGILRHELPISYVPFNGKWYLYEIVNTAVF